MSTSTSTPTPTPTSSTTARPPSFFRRLFSSRRAAAKLLLDIDIDASSGVDRAASIVVALRPGGNIGVIQDALGRAGLVSSKVVYRKSRTVRDRVLLLVDAPDSVIRHKAARLAIEGWKRGGLGELRLPDRDLRHADRLLHLSYILLDDEEGPRLTSKFHKDVLGVYALHDDDATRQLLAQRWSLRTQLNGGWQDELTTIRHLYGDEVAWFRTWHGHFVLWLIPASVLGLVVQIVQAMSGSRRPGRNAGGPGGGDDVIILPTNVARDTGTGGGSGGLSLTYDTYEVLLPLYSLFMLVWGFLLVKFLNRRCAILQHAWHTTERQEATSRRREDFAERADKRHELRWRGGSAGMNGEGNGGGGDGEGHDAKGRGGGKGGDAGGSGGAGSGGRGSSENSDRRHDVDRSADRGFDSNARRRASSDGGDSNSSSHSSSRTGSGAVGGAGTAGMSMLLAPITGDEDGVTVLTYPRWKRWLKMLMNVPVIAFFLFVVLAARTVCFGFVMYMYLYHGTGLYVGPFTFLVRASPDIVFALLVDVLVTTVFSAVARRLAKWECYEFQHEYEASVTRKAFALYMCSFFGYWLLLAFLFVPSNLVFGNSKWLTDTFGAALRGMVLEPNMLFITTQCTGHWLHDVRHVLNESMAKVNLTDIMDAATMDRPELAREWGDCKFSFRQSIFTQQVIIYVCTAQFVEILLKLLLPFIFIRCIHTLDIKVKRAVHSLRATTDAGSTTLSARAQDARVQRRRVTVLGGGGGVGGKGNGYGGSDILVRGSPGSSSSASSTPLVLSPATSLGSPSCGQEVGEGGEGEQRASEPQRGRLAPALTFFDVGDSHGIPVPNPHHQTSTARGGGVVGSGEEEASIPVGLARLRLADASLKKTAIETILKEIARPVYDPAGDYGKTACQFAFVAMFSSVFPAMPLLMLVSNLFALRADKVTLVYQTSRPLPFSKPSIGAWMGIFKFICFASVLVNLGVTYVSLGFGENILALLFRITSSGIDLNNTIVSRLAMVVLAFVVERIVTTLFSLFNRAISDEPRSVTEDRAREAKGQRERYKLILDASMSLAMPHSAVNLHNTVHVVLHSADLRGWTPLHTSAVAEAGGGGADSGGYAAAETGKASAASADLLMGGGGATNDGVARDLKREAGVGFPEELWVPSPPSPYLVLRMVGDEEETYRTATEWDTPGPVWEEQSQVVVDDDAQFLELEVLRVEIWHDHGQRRAAMVSSSPRRTIVGRRPTWTRFGQRGQGTPATTSASNASTTTTTSAAAAATAASGAASKDVEMVRRVGDGVEYDEHGMGEDDDIDALEGGTGKGTSTGSSPRRKTVMFEGVDGVERDSPQRGDATNTGDDEDDGVANDILMGYAEVPVRSLLGCSSSNRRTVKLQGVGALAECTVALSFMFVAAKRLSGEGEGTHSTPERIRREGSADQDPEAGDGEQKQSTMSPAVDAGAAAAHSVLAHGRLDALNEENESEIDSDSEIEDDDDDSMMMAARSYATSIIEMGTVGTLRRRGNSLY